MLIKNMIQEHPRWTAVLLAIMNGILPTVEDALALYDRGLAVIPALNDDGKSPEGIVASFNKWNRRLPRDKTAELFLKHPGANVAILPHLCRPRLVVVDCDDEVALTAALQRYGATSLRVRTPRRAGGHLYYRAPTTRVGQRTLLHSEGLAIEIKAGAGAVVIVPPSRRPSSGVPYIFVQGGWESLMSLPVFNPMPSNRTDLQHMASSNVREGGRNQHLLGALLRHAPTCTTLGELEGIALVLNERDCDPPLSWSEVRKIARSAWSYEITGKNLVGGPRCGIFLETEHAALEDEPKAFSLLCKLRLEHRGQRGSFAASPKAMARDGVLKGWTVAGYRQALQVLVERGLLEVTHPGGRCPGDARSFSFAGPAGIKGSDSAPNTNLTPSSLPLALPAAASPRRKAA